MTESELKQHFENFKNFNILVIGDVMVDAYLWGRVDRVSPEAPVPVVMCTRRENRLGGAANVALNIQALGATPILCAVVGKDEKKEIFFDLLQKNHLTNEGILVEQTRKTTVKTRVISQHQHLLRVDDEIDSPLHEALEERFISHVLNLLNTQKIDAIVFEDYDKGVITSSVIEKIVYKANEMNIPTLVDPKKRNFNLYKNVTVFKPNFKELLQGLNLDIEKGDFEGLHYASLQLHRSQNVKFVLITLSELGIFISDKTSFAHVPAKIRDILDVSGAGDTVIGTAAVCFAANLSPLEIAEISNLAGGMVCEKVGVVPINKTQLLQECISHFAKI